jgi:hypothetical protein
MAVDRPNCDILLVHFLSRCLARIWAEAMLARIFLMQWKLESVDFWKE